MLEHDFFTILMVVTGLYMLVLGLVMKTNDFVSTCKLVAVVFVMIVSAPVLADVTSNNEETIMVSYNPDHVIKCSRYETIRNLCVPAGHVDSSLLDHTLDVRGAASPSKLGCVFKGLKDVKNVLEIYKKGLRESYYLIVYDPEGRKC